MGSIYKVFQKVLTFNGIFRVLAPVVRYDDVFGQPGLRSFLCHVSRTLRGTSCNHIHQSLSGSWKHCIRGVLMTALIH